MGKTVGFTQGGGMLDSEIRKPYLLKSEYGHGRSATRILNCRILRNISDRVNIMGVPPAF